MPGPTLSIDVKRVNNVHVLILAGAIDASSIEQTRQFLEPLVAIPGARILLDCQALQYVNSTGFGLLFNWARVCQENQGQLALAGLARKITNLMKVLGLEKYLTVYSSRETALAAMEGRPGT
jgi:anti-sigma B factor antagonist